MKRSFFLIFPLLISTLFFAESAPRPNILYLYVDDMGWGSLGPNGQFERKKKGLPRVLTPNLDRLAARSVNFTRAYGCTVCSPARSSQQTGFHQGHTFKGDRNDPNNAKKAMRADDVLMGDVLSQAGYTTGYWGKWGYGGSKDQENPTIDNVQTLPTSHGYQFVLAELHHVRAHTFFQPTLWSAPSKKGGLELVPNSMAKYIGKKEYPNEPSLHNHPDYPKVAYCDDAYCFAALDFVRAGAKEYRATGKPFFGLLAVQVPHAPFDEIEELPHWERGYKDQPKFAKLAAQTRQWAAMVTRIDGHFGNLFQALEDPDGDGDTSDLIAENTLIIFQSDNGGPGGPSNRELDTNGGLRGTKGSIYEGGIRVPTMMSWPAKISKASQLKAGTSTDRVIDVSDLLPTFCELAGVDTPTGLDGVSLAPTLTGVGEQRMREFLIHEAGKGQSIIRGKYKLIRTKKQLELYDLEADRSESNDIAKGNEKLVEELEALLLGERVDEPRGFANTYHHWTGSNGSKTSDPKNWSDYVYSNAGITYLEDKGAPRISWTATFENEGSEAVMAKGDVDLEFLSLEVRGEKAPAELALEKGVNLVGRNEIRLAKGAILRLNGGTVSSLRWIDVKPGAQLRGTGKVEGTLYNSGEVSLVSAVGNGGPILAVLGSYRESPGSNLSVVVPQLGKTPTLVVSGEAKLRGNLAIAIETEANLKPGAVFPVIKADQIEGRFSNPGNRIILPGGKIFGIEYSENMVFLRVQKNEVRHLISENRNYQ